MASASSYAGARDYNGLMSGRGALDTPSGVRYEGEFRDGHFEGRGTLVFANGARYSATWEAGLEVPGSGGYVWADGLAYNLPEQSAGGGAAGEAAEGGEGTAAAAAAAAAAGASGADLARWPYLNPHDRRLWSEHRAGVRADVAYVTATRKQQLSSMTLDAEALALRGSAGALAITKVVVAKR